MIYLLVEKENLVGVCDYEPNTGDDDITVLPYSGNIPKERVLYVDKKIVDSNDYVFINGTYAKNTKAVMLN